ILYRTKDDNLEIAVVKSAKDKNWCLPKGKADVQDDSLLKTAVRETEEETGCVAEPVEYAGDFSYQIDGATKMVFMWHMNLISENVKPIEPDILELRWLSPPDAVAVLDRKRERRFLSRIFMKEDSTFGYSIKLRLMRSARLEAGTLVLPDSVESNYLPLEN
ncbi:MAG TPA: NUDIX domain-containing protein, partial [candidate division Zixibacteria bacterium]|nr:NUDIX domain-containing protein [candidate division Zixibacteria bacterium]